MNRAKLRRLIKLVGTWRFETRWILLGIAASAVVVYLNILGNGFVFDDWQQIVDNPFLRRADGLAKIFTTGVWQFLGQVGVSNFYRPLMHAMFFGGFRAFGLNPAGYHAVSIAWHMLVSLLVYLLVVEMTRVWSGAPSLTVRPLAPETLPRTRADAGYGAPVSTLTGYPSGLPAGPRASLSTSTANKVISRLSARFRGLRERARRHGGRRSIDESEGNAGTLKRASGAPSVSPAPGLCESGRDPGDRQDAGAPYDKLTAAFAALLFAVHPVHTEPVAWISAYPELLCALFSLAAMWLYVRTGSRFKVQGSRSEAAARPSWTAMVMLVATGPLLFAALLAKEIAIAVPLLLIAYELLKPRGEPKAQASAATSSHREPEVGGGRDARGPRAGVPETRSVSGSSAGRTPPLPPFPGLAAKSAAKPGKSGAPTSRRPPSVRGFFTRHSPLATRRFLPAYASMALAIAAYLAMRVHALGALMPAPARHLPLNESVWTAFAVFWRYFQVQLLPVRLHAFYYLKPSGSPFEPPVLAGIALVAGLVMATWWLWRKNRPEAWAVPLYVLPLAPALLLPYASVGLLMAERYVYLSSVAFCWAAGAVLAAAIRNAEKLGGWWPQMVRSLGVVVRGGWAVVRGERNRSFSSAAADPAERDRGSVGAADFSRGSAGAAGSSRPSVGTTSHPSPRTSHLATWHLAPLFVAAAFALLFAAYAVRTVVRNADWRDEISFYRQTIADFPDFPRAHLNLGEALMRRDRLSEAREATEAATRLDPQYPDPYMNLGLLDRQQGNLPSAEAHFRKAAVLARAQGNRFVASRALTNLAVAYRAAGRLPESVAASEQALAVDPMFAGGHNNLAFALLLLDRADDAIPHLARAIELDPTLDVAWSNLGLAYSMKADLPRALELLQRAERLNPANAETHARAAEVLLALGRVQQAVQELTSALQIDPSNPRALKLKPPEQP